MFRRKALRIWKMNLGIKATYENLLKVFVEAEYEECVHAVCDVLRKKCEGKTIYIYKLYRLTPCMLNRANKELHSYLPNS